MINIRHSDRSQTDLSKLLSRKAGMEISRKDCQQCALGTDYVSSFVIQGPDHPRRERQ